MYYGQGRGGFKTTDLLSVFSSANQYTCITCKIQSSDNDTKKLLGCKVHVLLKAVFQNQTL